MMRASRCRSKSNAWPRCRRVRDAAQERSCYDASGYRLRYRSPSAVAADPHPKRKVFVVVVQPVGSNAELLGCLLEVQKTIAPVKADPPEGSAASASSLNMSVFSAASAVVVRARLVRGSSTPSLSGSATSSSSLGTAYSPPHPTFAAHGASFCLPWYSA